MENENKKKILYRKRRLTYQGHQGVLDEKARTGRQSIDEADWNEFGDLRVE